MSIGIGDALRGAREEQGRTIEEASRATRVRSDYLRALEDEDFARLGGDVYAKGFLSAYARFLGLDPDPLLERYRQQVERTGYDAHELVVHPVAGPPRQAIPTWVVWAGVSVAVLLAALAVVGLVGGRTPQRAAPGTTATASPTTNGGAEPSPTVTQSPTPSPTPTPTGVELTLLYEGRSWTLVRLAGPTGQKVLEDTVEAGQNRSFEHPDGVYLHLGDAGAVRLVLNGENVGNLGPRGQIWRGTCTSEGCRALEE
ncbi:MAG: DUF4115 domain-containing protein [Actinomycetota bacterium]|nr:DUF4115 domain-containing protein [Actinomycetota bacterium]